MFSRLNEPQTASAPSLCGRAPTSLTGRVREMLDPGESVSELVSS
jgi:hypothetical protein